MWKLVTKEKSEMRKGYEARVQDLTPLLKEDQAKIKKEIHLKEKAFRKYHCVSTDWTRMQEELESLQRLKEEHDTLVSDIIYWNGEIQHYKDVAKEDHDQAREYKQQSEIWHNRFTKMMDYTNNLIGEFPKKVQEAFESMTVENTHPTVFHFVFFCKHMGKRIGEELEDI